MGVGYPVGWCCGDVARLCDSAYHCGMAVAKTQLLSLHTQSLPSFLPCSLGSAARNVLITQAPLLRASEDQTLPRNLPSPSSCRKLQLHIAAPLFRCPNLPPSLGTICPPFDAPMHTSLRCACVQVGCYFLNCRCSDFCYFKRRDPGRSLMLPCF